jgi:hypothetical protein
VGRAATARRAHPAGAAAEGEEGERAARGQRGGQAGVGGDVAVEARSGRGAPAFRSKAEGAGTSPCAFWSRAAPRRWPGPRPRAHPPPEEPPSWLEEGPRESEPPAEPEPPGWRAPEGSSTAAAISRQQPASPSAMPPRSRKPHEASVSGSGSCARRGSVSAAAARHGARPHDRGDRTSQALASQRARACIASASRAAGSQPNSASMRPRALAPTGVARRPPGKGAPPPLLHC